VVIDCDMEALTLRQVIECFGEAHVGLFGVGRASHLISCLRGEKTAAEHLVICCHGDDEGIILPELHPSVAVNERYVDRFGREAVCAEARLDGQVVICTGCSTGMLADSFLQAGAGAFIGPTSDPHGSAPLAFLAVLYYRLLACGDTLEKACERARRTGGDTRLFGLFLREHRQTKEVAGMSMTLGPTKRSVQSVGSV
jgi:hypothetical protein